MVTMASVDPEYRLDVTPRLVLMVDLTTLFSQILRWVVSIRLARNLEEAGAVYTGCSQCFRIRARVKSLRGRVGLDVAISAWYLHAWST